MTKMHFERLAQLVYNLDTVVNKRELAKELADFCQYYNSRFDRDRFFVACGVAED